MNQGAPGAVAEKEIGDSAYKFVGTSDKDGVLDGISVMEGLSESDGTEDGT